MNDLTTQRFDFVEGRQIGPAPLGDDPGTLPRVPLPSPRQRVRWRGGIRVDPPEDTRPN